MGYGVLIPTFMTFIIIVGPLIKAIEDRDWNEILVDTLLLIFFWSGYIILTRFEINEIEVLNGIFN